MRVLLTLSSGRVGGAEMHVLWLAQGLRARGLEAEVACRPGALTARLEAAGVPVHPLAFGDGVDLVTPLRLARLARGYDLVHAHMNRASLYTRAACALARRPWVTTAHGMTKGVYYRGADRVIAVSQAVERHLAAQGVGPLTVILNGLPAPAAPGPEERAAVAAALGAAPDDQVLAVVLANLHPNKGQDLLVEALAKLPPQYRVLLAGAGELPRLGELYAAHPGLEARVVRLGVLPSAAAPFEAADVVVVPSRREAFSLVAAEARMRGVPVLVADVDGLVEVVPDGAPGGARVAGRDPARWAEALASLGEDLTATRQAAEAGASAACERFQLEPCVDAVAAVYREVLAG